MPKIEELAMLLLLLITPSTILESDQPRFSDSPTGRQGFRALRAGGHPELEAFDHSTMQVGRVIAGRQEGYRNLEPPQIEDFILPAVAVARDIAPAHDRDGSCVTSIVGPNGDAQLYER